MSPLPESIKPSAARGAAQIAKLICDSPVILVEGRDMEVIIKDNAAIEDLEIISPRTDLSDIEDLIRNTGALANGQIT